MAYLSYTKDMPGVADVFWRDPELYAPLLQFIEGVMTRPSELSKAEREMIAAHVSRQNGCDFCVGAHRWTLAAMDVDRATIDALEKTKTESRLYTEYRERFHLPLLAGVLILLLELIMSATRFMSLP